jgi:hypothetical protein
MTQAQQATALLLIGSARRGGTVIMLIAGRRSDSASSGTAFTGYPRDMGLAARSVKMKRCTILCIILSLACGQCRRG